MTTLPSKAHSLLILENSGGLDTDLRELMNSNRAGELDLALKLQGAPYSVALQAYAKSESNVFKSGASIEFHSMTTKDQQSLSDLKNVMPAGAGGTYLQELLYLGITQHIREKGHAPETIFFWSDFCDMLPSTDFFNQKVLTQSPEVLEALSKTKFYAIVPEAGQVDEVDPLKVGKEWAAALKTVSGCSVTVLPEKGLGAYFEAQQLEHYTARGNSPTELVTSSENTIARNLTL